MRSPHAFVFALVTTTFACGTAPDGEGGDEIGDSGESEDSGEGSESGSSSEESTSETSDTGESDTGESDTGESDTGESDTGESDTGEPCDPFETTVVAECPRIIGEGFCSEGATHVEEGSAIEWMNNPPHSGNHYPTWQTVGEHVEPVPRGNWVHNLEHGWVVLVHNCAQDCETELDVLREVMDLRPDASILMTPDPLLDAPRFAAISWTWVYEFDTPVLEELLCFVDQHHDHAPESVH